jgi:formate hydrogenlyase subunit 3/multisubunit Na+/H+ antiporter MnhD subunit
MNEQEFQLELERFKQKASWENKIFYTFLGFLISVILFYIQQGKVGETSFWLWFGGLGLFLILGEFLIHCYLDTQMQKIKNKTRRIK